MSVWSENELDGVFNLVCRNIQKNVVSSIGQVAFSMRSA